METILPNRLDLEGYLTKVQVAERFQKSTSTIDRWCKEGILPYIKIGKGRTASVFFNWEDVRNRLRTKFGFNVN